MDEALDAQEFTQRAWEHMYEALDDPYFERRDSELIYDALRRRLRFVPFSDFLKRYIYRVAELPEPFDEVPQEEYLQIICDSFADNNTPPSFESRGGRLPALARGWLTRQSVRRETVFLLGFGLGMSLDDVNEFLTKALREPQIDPLDPFEAVCGYCYRRRYGYMRFVRLREACSEAARPSPREDDIGERTMNAQLSFEKLTSDRALIDYVAELGRGGVSRQSASARNAYETLYDQARELIAALYNQERSAQRRRPCTKEDISESDVEHILCSAVPTDRHGNLTPSRASLLNEQFAGRRFNRQHMNKVLSGGAEIDRFDLITLNFFVYSLEPERYANAKQRYSAFIRSMNEILDRCRMGRLYVTNPYECFVLMCILSDDPLGTYADVWELSYEKTASSENGPDTGG